ncbi:MAG: hypothetical protein ABEJ72_05720, partial [Candidatus Aenigmatarchaeota archaeon]
MGINLDGGTAGTVEGVPNIDTAGLKSPTQSNRGTSQPLYRYGMLNYVSFAYSIPVFVLALLGISYFFIKRRNKDWLIVLWAFVIFTSTYLLMTGSRVEDVSRNTLFVIPPLTIAAGYFTSKVYDYLDSFSSLGKMLSVGFLVIILGWAFFAASAKAESLRPIKSFSPAFFEGCDWIQQNTPKDSTI